MNSFLLVGVSMSMAVAVTAAQNGALQMQLEPAFSSESRLEQIRQQAQLMSQQEQQAIIQQQQQQQQQQALAAMVQQQQQQQAMQRQIEQKQKEEEEKQKQQQQSTDESSSSSSSSSSSFAAVSSSACSLIKQAKCTDSAVTTDWGLPLFSFPSPTFADCVAHCGQTANCNHGIWDQLQQICHMQQYKNPMSTNCPIVEYGFSFACTGTAAANSCSYVKNAYCMDVDGTFGIGLGMPTTATQAECQLACLSTQGCNHVVWDSVGLDCYMHTYQTPGSLNCNQNKNGHSYFCQPPVSIDTKPGTSVRAPCFPQDTYIIPASWNTINESDCCSGSWRNSATQFCPSPNPIAAVDRVGCGTAVWQCN